MTCSFFIVLDPPSSLTLSKARENTIVSTPFSQPLLPFPKATVKL